MWTCCKQDILVALYGVYGTCSRAGNVLKALEHSQALASNKVHAGGQTAHDAQPCGSQSFLTEQRMQTAQAHELEEELQHVDLL